MVELLFIIGASIIVLPLINLAHELGHAVFALYLTSGFVSITIGIEKKICSFRIGRLEINVRSIFVLGGQTQYVEPIPYRDHALIILGGPMFSLLFSITALILLIVLRLSRLTSMLVV